MQEFLEAYKILYAIYFNKSYSNIEINKRDIKGNIDLVYKIVYGVLEEDIKLEKILEIYADKKPDNIVKVILKIAIYCLDNVSSMPHYAVVNNAVKITDTLKVSSAKKCVNWLLRAYIRKERNITYKNDIEKASVVLNVPIWILRKISSDYSNKAVVEIFDIKKNYLEEVRANTRIISHEELLEILDKNKQEYCDCKDYIKIKNSKILLELFNSGKITYHSSSSMEAVKFLQIRNGERMLDLCAAPGGKSIYALEIAPQANVIACDIHEHRLELIKAYAQRMGEKRLKILKNDATQFNQNFINKFDKILVDAPCSGLGVYMKKPDILIRLKENDVFGLSEIQTKILDNAIKYLKPGGLLVYSTCTLFKQENEMVVNEVLKNNSGYELVAYDNDNIMKTIFPGEKNRDGFFMAKIKRCK